jgi:hypothetical protein
MSRISCLCSFLIGSSGMLFLAGCGANQVAPLASPGWISAGTTSSAPPALPPATQKNIYVVQAGRDPISTLVFPLTAHGSATPTLEIPGSQVAVDGAGNIYVLDQKGYPDFTVTSINVYSGDSPTGKPIRSLPVGPGTKISAVRAMTVSPAGEIFVSDFKGIAVFSPTATADADPVRYIQDLGVGGSTAAASAAFMAVDNADNPVRWKLWLLCFRFRPKRHRASRPFTDHCWIADPNGSGRLQRRVCHVWHDGRQFGRSLCALQMPDGSLCPRKLSCSLRVYPWCQRQRRAYTNFYDNWDGNLLRRYRSRRGLGRNRLCQRKLHGWAIRLRAGGLRVFRRCFGYRNPNLHPHLIRMESDHSSRRSG